MEVSSVNRPSANIKKQHLVSESKYSPIPSSTVEPVGADDEQDTNKCNHFSLRGYVAEVRRRDTKINWPFQMLQNSLDEHACLLPPLSVIKFRWWNCQNCVHETIAPDAVTENEAVMRIQNDKVKIGNGLLLVNDTVASHPDVTQSVSIFPQLSHPDVIKDLAKEGTKISTVGQERSEEDQNHSSRPNVNSIDENACQTGEEEHVMVSASNQNHLSKPNVNSIDRDACQTGEQGRVMVSASTSEVGLLGGATPNIVSLKRKGSELIQGTSGSEMPDKMITSMTNGIAASCPSNDQVLSRIGEMKELGNCATKEHGMLPLRVNVGVPRFDALAAMSVDISGYESMSLYRGRQKVSEDKFHLTNNMVQHQLDAPQTSISAENCNHRKARKVRLLEDIMRSDKFHRTENVCTPNGDKTCSGNHHSRRPDVPEENFQHLGHDTHQNTESKPMKTKNRIEAVISDDERPSLVHWVKRMPKQKISCKRDSEVRSITNATGTSKFVAKQYAEKLPDLNLEVCGEKGINQEIIVGRKNQIPEVNLAQRSVIPTQDSMTWKGHKINLPQPSVIPAQDSMTWKGHKISKDLVRKFSHSSVNSKSAGIVISEKSLYHQIETQKYSHKMAPFSKMKNKRPQVEDGGSSQIHWSKDSFSLQKQAGYQVQEKVMKKQRTVRTMEKEIPDDIPMDIVELLARNQHERRLMNGEAATENRQTTIEMTEDNNDESNRGVIDCHVDKVSDVLHRNLFQQNSESSTKGYGVQTSESKDNANYRAYHSSTNAKQNLNIDLNLQAPISASTDAHAFSQYVGLSMKGSQLAVIEPGSEGSTQNFCWNRTTILASVSNHKDPSTSGQNSCRNAHDGPLALLNSTPFVTNPQNVDSNSSHWEKGYNTPFLHEASYRKPIDSSDTYIWGEDKDQSCTSGGTTAAASSCLDAGYVCPSNSMGPVGLYPNDTRSALNLLRLMDRAASAEQCHSSMGNNYIGPTWGPAIYSNCQGNTLLGSEVGMRSTEVFQHPLTVGMLDRDLQLGNSCKPLRPLPRFGILGPLLQKEIADNSNKCRTPFGLGAKIANELTPLKNNGKDNGEASHSTICFNVLNARTSVSRCQNSKWIPPSSGFRSHPSCFLMKNDNGQVRTGNQDRAVQPLSSSCVAEVCVLNRNPADFSIPDEDNPYMIGNEEQGPAYMPTSGRLQRPTYFGVQKEQKVIRLNDLKGSARIDLLGSSLPPKS